MRIHFQSQALISTVMVYESDSEIAFGQWMRRMLEQMLGDEPDIVHRVSFPIKRFARIATEEVFRYLCRKQWRARNNRRRTYWRLTRNRSRAR